MQCKKPLTAYPRKDGSPGITFNPAEGLADAPQTFSCYKCANCRANRSREWVVRFIHESRCHNQDEIWFLTLTYDEANLPINGSLEYPDVQKFMKRLRKKHPNVRFYCACEYGSDQEGTVNPFTQDIQLGRPHYHLILWGLPLDDYEENAVRKQFGCSQEIDNLWGKGQTTIDPATPETYKYCAGYLNKKMFGDKAEGHYTRLNPRTGEVTQLEPEKSRMSTKPAIGGNFLNSKWDGEEYADFESDLLKGFITDGTGKRMPIPRSYINILKKTHRQDTVEKIQEIKRLKAEEYEKILEEIPEEVRHYREQSAEKMREENFQASKRKKHL